MHRLADASLVLTPTAQGVDGGAGHYGLERWLGQAGGWAEPAACIPARLCVDVSPHWISPDDPIHCQSAYTLKPRCVGVSAANCVGDCRRVAPGDPHCRPT